MPQTSVSDDAILGRLGTINLLYIYWFTGIRDTIFDESLFQSFRPHSYGRRFPGLPSELFSYVPTVKAPYEDESQFSFRFLFSVFFFVDRS